MKTSQVLHAVLSSAYKTYTTEGNLNNHIGITLTLLKIRPDAEMAIIEMGANHQKEIEGYCRYTRPTHGIITNCGKAHLEGFGGVEGIKKGKGELFDYLRANNGTAFVMWDYEYLQEMSAGIPYVMTYGTHAATVTGTVQNSSGLLEVAITNDAALGTIKTNLVGEYNLPNILLAATVGKYFKVPADKIKSALENYLPSNSRSQLIEKNSNKIILDAYNANPTSMKAAIENFAKMDGTDKVLLLGGMMELGQESLHEHQQLIELIKKYSWKNVVLVRGDFIKVDHPFYRVSTPNMDENKFSSKVYSVNINGGTSLEIPDYESLINNKNISPDGKFILSDKSIKIDNVHGFDRYPDLKLSTAQVYTSLDYRRWDTWNDGHFNHVFMMATNASKDNSGVDIMKDEPFNCPTKPFGGDEDYIWHSDGNSVVYVSKKLSGTQAAQSTNTDLYQYNIKTGKTENLTENNKGYDTNPSYSENGDLAYLSMKTDGYEADKNDIKVISKGITSNLTAQWDGTVNSFIWANDNRPSRQAAAPCTPAPPK